MYSLEVGSNPVGFQTLIMFLNRTIANIYPRGLFESRCVSNTSHVLKSNCSLYIAWRLVRILLVVKHLSCSEIELQQIYSLEVGSNPVGCQTLIMF